MTKETSAFFPQKDRRIDSVVASTYRIVSPLAEGGMGTIYRARYLSSNEEVAIKFLRGEYSDQPEAVARFEREMKLLVGLAHENIVRAFDCGKTPENELYLVMELAPGETLRAVIERKGALPVPTVVAVARRIGAALTRAHTAGVVHRDLKPENVVVADIDAEYPSLKVLDFGMAGIASGLLAGSPLTQAGSVFGSPSYMAPEQVLAKKVDARGDQYSFGIMLYEMLAGHKPFRAEEAIDLLQMHIRAPVPPLATTAPKVPAAVAAVVERMLSKKPEDRFPDVASAVEALASAAGLPATASVVPAAPSPVATPAPTAAPTPLPAVASPSAVAPRGLGSQKTLLIAVALGVALIVALALLLTR